MLMQLKEKVCYIWCIDVVLTVGLVIGFFLAVLCGLTLLRPELKRHGDYSYLEDVHRYSIQERFEETQCFVDFIEETEEEVSCVQNSRGEWCADPLREHQRQGRTTRRRVTRSRRRIRRVIRRRRRTSRRRVDSDGEGSDPEFPPDPEGPFPEVPPDPEEPFPEVPPDPEEPFPEVPPDPEEPFPEVPPDPEEPFPEVQPDPEEPFPEVPPDPEEPFPEVPPDPEEPFPQVPPDPEEPFPEVPPDPEEPFPEVPPDPEEPFPEVPPDPEEPFPEIPQEPTEPFPDVTAYPTKDPFPDVLPQPSEDPHVLPQPSEDPSHELTPYPTSELPRVPTKAPFPELPPLPELPKEPSPEPPPESPQRRSFPCVRMHVQFTERKGGHKRHGVAHENLTQAENFPKCSFSFCDGRWEFNKREVEKHRLEWNLTKHTKHGVRCIYNRHDLQQVILLSRLASGRHGGILRSAAFHATFWPILLFVVCFMILATRQLCFKYGAHAELKGLPEKSSSGIYMIDGKFLHEVSEKEKEAFMLGIQVAAQTHGRRSSKVAPETLPGGSVCPIIGEKPGLPPRQIVVKESNTKANDPKFVAEEENPLNSKKLLSLVPPAYTERISEDPPPYAAVLARVLDRYGYESKSQVSET